MKHWDGPICVLVGDKEAMEICQHLDGIDQVELKEFDFAALKSGKRGDVYYAKTNLHKMTPFDRTIYLDADTLVTGEITELLPEDDELLVMQWMDWVTTGTMMKGRLENWRDVAPDEVNRMVASDYPAINTGVIGFSKKCAQAMDAWHKMTMRNVSFICDEIAMQLMYWKYPHRQLDDRFNASPKYMHMWRRHGVDRTLVADADHYYVDDTRVVPQHTVDELSKLAQRDDNPTNDVRVWHGHGFKFIKSPTGRFLWWPVFRQAVAENFCGIGDWTPWNRTRWPKCAFNRYVNDPTQWQ
jgi:hypothetical protein